MFQQQMRPEAERGLPEWQLMALDRQRYEEHKNRAQNPALWQKLEELDVKLDQVLKLLKSSTPA